MNYTNAVFKTEVIKIFESIDKGDNILVDSEIQKHVKLKAYQLEPDEIRITINQITSRESVIIQFTILYNKFNNEAEDEIIEKLKEAFGDVVISFVEEEEKGEMKKVIYEINYK